MKSRRRKIKTYEHAGISIRELRPELPEGGGGYFQVDLMRRGLRERTGFDTLAKAKNYCERIGLKIETEGAAVLALNPGERQDAIAARNLLLGKVSLLDAARFWMRHHGGVEGITMAELGRRWLANLKAQECRPATLRERGYKVESLTKVLGPKLVAGVTKEDLLAWMNGKTGATLDTYRRTALAMLNYAVEEGMADFNVAAKIKPVRLDESLPKPLPVEAVRSIMATAEKWAPAIVPTLAVQFFGGLRPGEAMGLDWSAIDFKQRIIRVAPEVSKVRRTRIVPINQTLLDWLQPYHKPTGTIGIVSKAQFGYFMHRKPIGPEYEQEGVPIGERKPDKRPKGLIAAAKVKWIQDGPRKTFATAHFATHGDAAKLAGILGHVGGNDVLYRHYRGLMTKADAGRFWKIRPASAGKVVAADFKRAAG